MCKYPHNSQELRKFIKRSIMSKLMPREKPWKQINIRTNVYNFIKELITKYPGLGYGTINEFARDAVRKLLKKSLDELKIDPAATPDDLFEKADDAP